MEGHRFEPFGRWMEGAGLGSAAVEAFRHNFSLLEHGETGIIPESDIEPLSQLPISEEIGELAATGQEAIGQTAVLKLNGGLGTGMGLNKAKSLVSVKNGISFLEIIARQILELRRRTATSIPLVLMNSFGTDADSLEALSPFPDLDVGLPLSFIQNRVPKVCVDGLCPPETGPADPISWCPPGHGDLYVALQTSGILEAFRRRGIRYLFVSNSDNLGAVLDFSILGFLVSERLPFLMEVADRTESDRKGGHIARRTRDGRLILRESAQTHRSDEDSFQNIALHRYFNTNNIWLDVDALTRELSLGVLKLPLIRNEKTLDPRDSASPRVFQLETAMGSAIEVFEGAGAIRVPRTRFAPVKTTSDLLVVRSDAYLLTDDYRVTQNPLNRAGVPLVSLDSEIYRLVDRFEARFSRGTPSLVECESLTVEGDVSFGANVRVEGRASVRNPSPVQAHIPDGTVLFGDTVL